MTFRYLLLAGLMTGALGAPSLAANDPRIRQIAYNAHAVTTLRGCTGYQSTIAFDAGEKIENVALGNAALWQAVPNRRSDLLFLRPLIRNGRTNMEVVTDRRRYSFDLVAHDDLACHAGHVTYDLTFSYPDEPSPGLIAALEQATPPAPPLPLPPPDADLPPVSARNVAYTFTGTAANVPERVFDDGHSTYMRWAEDVAAPAIYALGADKSETLLNFTVKGDYSVVDGVQEAFVLRRGSAVAVLYNDAYQQPKLDAAAPQPRQKHARRRDVARALSSSQDGKAG
jgi:type IV secretion system protein VirB9